MYLRDWKSIIGKGDMPGKYLSIKATMECPFCGTTDTLETEGYLISEDDREGTIERQVRQLSNGFWPCCRCGIVSALPEKDAKKFKKELRAKITRKWLKKHEH